MAVNYVPRVTQLDAVQLDDEVAELLKQQMIEATKFMEPGILQPVLPELEAIMRTLIFKYSLYDKKSTFGQQMLSLKYNQNNLSTSKLWWYYGYTVGLRYLKERGVYSFTRNQALQRAIHNLERVQLFGDVINFLRFIQSGSCPSLIDFILNLEITADKITREDLTDFSWTRELLWHNFIELFGTVISLMNLFGLKKKISGILQFAWWRKTHQIVPTGNPITFTLNTICASCSNKPVLPHTMGCNHIFCYYCLKANKMADQDYACPQCHFNGKTVTKYIMP